MTTNLSSPLEWLLDPVPSDSFLATRWEREPLRVARQQPGYYHEIFNHDDLNQAIHAAARVPGSLEEMSDGPPRRCRSHLTAQHSYAAGRSLRIDGAQRFCRNLLLLTRALEQRLSAFINVNVYLTPASQRALSRHFDTHDVFVLQVFGKKRWRLYDGAVTAPLEYLPPARGETHEHMKRLRLDAHRSHGGKEERTQTDEFVLSEGDLFYLPRGIWHEAAAEPGFASCHLTVGVQPYTYLDLLSLALAEAALREPWLRRALPTGFATWRDGRHAVADHLARHWDGPIDRLALDSALAALAKIFLNCRQPAPHLDPSGDVQEPVHDHSIVKVPPGSLCGVAIVGETVAFTVGDQTALLPMASEPACRRIADRLQFCPADLAAAMGADASLDLTRRLVAVRALEVVTPREPAPAPSRWMPVRITLAGQPQVEWCNMTSPDVRDPFFHMTAKRLRSAGRPFRRTPLGELLRLQSGCEPSGLIFHVSRCGSTLLANMLRLAPQSLVISEAQPFSAIIRELRSGTLGIGREVLSQALCALAAAYTPEGCKLIVKFSSWNVLAIDILRQIWPSVPCLVVIREPREVLVSCIRSPPGWAQAADRAGWSEAFDPLPATGKAMSPEDALALGVREFMRAVRPHLGETCRTLDYSQITVARSHALARFFGLDLSAVPAPAIERVFGTYSKDGDLRQPFAGDTQSKLAAVTPAVAAASDAWASDGYLALRGFSIFDNPELPAASVASLASQVASGG